MSSTNKNHMLYDKFPKQIKNATSTSDGLMSAEDKARMDEVFEFGLLTPATPEKDGLMSKEDKRKMDGIEENANNYIHPNTPDIRHVSDAEKNKWNTQIKYSNSRPVPATIGGIEKGTTFNNVDHNDLITRLLYPYIDPVLSNIVITPSKTILEKGENFILSRIQFNIDSPSFQNESLKYEFKNGSNIFNIINTENRSIDTLVTLIISDNTTISVTVTNSTVNKSKTYKLIDYKFIYPFYYGTLSSSEKLDESTIESKTKLLQEKSNKTIKFTTNNQKMMFAYPKTYGKLKTIYDANNFNVIDTFKITEITINSRDGSNIVYYVYTNDLSSVTDYNMQFIF